MHDADTVFATFDAHKDGDFKPYLLKSTDRGASWTSIAGDLPERGMVWAVAEDHVDAEAAVCGTEFGLFFTKTAAARGSSSRAVCRPSRCATSPCSGARTTSCSPPSAAASTFSTTTRPLRTADERLSKRPRTSSSPRTLWHTWRAARLGLSLQGLPGRRLLRCPNPPLGAVFTYHLAEGLKTRQEQRIEAEEKADEGKAPCLSRSRDPARRRRRARTEGHPDGARRQRDGRPPRRRAAGEGSTPRLLGPAPALHHAGGP